LCVVSFDLGLNRHPNHPSSDQLDHNTFDAFMPNQSGSKLQNRFSGSSIFHQSSSQTHIPIKAALRSSVTNEGLKESSDQIQKMGFLNPQKIKNFIAKIQKGEREKRENKETDELEDPSKGRRIILQDSHNFLQNQSPTEDPMDLLARTGSDEIETSREDKLLDNMVVNATASFQNAKMSNIKERTKALAAKLASHHSPKEGGIKYYAMSGLKKEFYSTMGHGAKLSENESERGQRKMMHSTSRNFLHSINQCISRLEGKQSLLEEVPSLPQEVPTSHRREQSLFEIGKHKHRQSGMSQRSQRTVEVDNSEPGERTFKRFMERDKKTTGSGNLKSNKEPNQEINEIKKANCQKEASDDNLNLQNEILKQKVSRLKEKLKEEMICKEYWREKYRDLEKRYNDLIMQQVRLRDERVHKSREVGTKSREVCASSSEIKPNKNFLTYTTQESARKPSEKKK
jgi:hypothetical protein